MISTKGSAMSQRTTLSAIFALHEQWAKAFAFACRKGCATCCTQSVTMTTLEGEMIHDHLTRQRPDLLPLLAILPGNGPVPAETTNQFAAACLRGEDADADTGSWDFSPCLFLQKECCAIYPARPFMCRGFGSRVCCAEGGEAEVEGLFLSLNTVIMQCIEHLDQGRPWGNMNTILRRIAANCKGEKTQEDASGPVAQPIPGFLLLPGEEAALREKLRILLRLLKEERAEGG